MERVLLAVITLIMVLFVYILENYINPIVFAVTVFVLILGYFFSILSKVIYALKEKYEILTHDDKPVISIIIAERNERNVIPDTIKNVKETNYPKDKYELMIVDDNSSDGTYEYLQGLDGIVLLRKPKDAAPGKPTALNLAIAQAKGDYILILDADARLSPGFLDELISEITHKRLKDPSLRAIQAVKRVLNRDENFLTASQDAEMLMDAFVARSREKVKGGAELRGNGMLIDRQALNEVGDFTPGVLTDDLDLSTKLHLAGYDVAISDYAEAYEEGVLDFDVLMKQRKRWGEGSLRRYLQYIPDVIASKKMGLGKKADILIFFVEFIFPPILVIDILYNLVTLHLPGAIAGILLLLTFLSFYAPMFFSNTQKGFKKFADAFFASVYMLHWILVIAYVIMIVLIKKGPSAWYKTPRQND